MDIDRAEWWTWLDGGQGQTRDTEKGRRGVG
jgi:hypothetical protein